MRCNASRPPETPAAAPWHPWAAARTSPAQGALSLPFDAAREQYAQAVRLGWLPRSMLASRDVERALDAWEKLSLGPLARRV